MCNGITVHRFKTSAQAYDRSQTGYLLDLDPRDELVAVEVKDGDLLLVESEQVIAVMVSAWPTAIFGQVPGAFHELHEKFTWNEVPVLDLESDEPAPPIRIRDYSKSRNAAEQIRRQLGIF